MRNFELLIVDDEPDLRWVLRGLFEDEGFVVREAADGDDALRAIAESSPDVVLSDMRMPRLPGIELLRTLRRDAPEVPVVLLKVLGLEEHALRPDDTVAPSHGVCVTGTGQRAGSRGESQHGAAGSPPPE